MFHSKVLFKGVRKYFAFGKNKQIQKKKTCKFCHEAVIRNFIFGMDFSNYYRRPKTI